MIILDTNVVSELMRPNPNPKVTVWVARQELSSIFTTTVSEAELHFGVEILPVGKRRDGLIEVAETILRGHFHNRILSFGRTAARAYGVVGAARRAAGLSVTVADCMIAAIAHVYGAVVATRDLDGFDEAGIEVINPWAD